MKVVTSGELIFHLERRYLEIYYIRSLKPVLMRKAAEHPELGTEIYGSLYFELANGRYGRVAATY